MPKIPTRRNAKQLAEHDLRREAQRLERLRSLMNSVPFVKTAAQLWTEQTAERQIDD